MERVRDHVAHQRYELEKGGELAYSRPRCAAEAASARCWSKARSRGCGGARGGRAAGGLALTPGITKTILGRIR